MNVRMLTGIVILSGSEKFVCKIRQHGGVILILSVTDANRGLSDCREMLPRPAGENAGLRDDAFGT